MLNILNYSFENGWGYFANVWNKVEHANVLQTSAGPCGVSAVCTKSRPQLTVSTKYVSLQNTKINLFPEVGNLFVMPKMVDPPQFWIFLPVVPSLGLFDFFPCVFSIVKEQMVDRPLVTLLYPVSLLSGCWDRWSLLKPKYKYRDHLVGQLTNRPQSWISPQLSPVWDHFLCRGLSHTKLACRKRGRPCPTTMWQWRTLSLNCGTLSFASFLHTKHL